MRFPQATGYAVNDAEYAVYEAGRGSPVVFLHGFTGSARSFRGLFESLSNDYHVFAVDLLGHGESDAPSQWTRYSMEHEIADLQALLMAKGLEKVTLLGYSMGGRVALSFACKYPHIVQSLILESSSPGLLNSEARKSRIQRDEELAERIVRDGMAKFVEFWESQPLFQQHRVKNPTLAADEREIRLSQRPQGLAGSLKGTGTGAQKSCWSELPSLNFPVLLLTGTRDAKFDSIARDMLLRLPNGQHIRIPDAGHTLHLEAPTEFEHQVRVFLTRTTANE